MNLQSSYSFASAETKALKVDQVHQEAIKSVLDRDLDESILALG